MVSKDESDFAKQRSFKTGLKNTNRKTDGSTKSFAAKKNVKKSEKKMKWCYWSWLQSSLMTANTLVPLQVLTLPPGLI